MQSKLSAGLRRRLSLAAFCQLKDMSSDGSVRQQWRQKHNLATALQRILDKPVH